jgi:hypothetical protein
MANFIGIVKRDSGAGYTASFPDFPACAVGGATVDDLLAKAGEALSMPYYGANATGARIAKGTVVHADEAGSWDNLHERFEVKRINHQEAYSLDVACTNWAE